MKEMAAAVVHARSAAARGGLLGNGGELAGDRVAAAFDGGGEDEAGDRVPVGEKGFNEGFKVGHGGGGDLEEEVVAAGEVMALADFFEGLHVFNEAMVMLAGTAHTDEGHDFKAEGFAIDFDGVAGEDADLFHLLEAFGGGSGGEANAATQFGEREAGVGLELVEELSAVGVE
jgi:hypothetical protein